MLAGRPIELFLNLIVQKNQTHQTWILYAERPLQNTKYDVTVT